MSDFLSRLAGRSLGHEQVLQPRITSRYEPVHNQFYQPFLPHFEWASSVAKAGDMESMTEMTESEPALVPNEHLSSKDNLDRADDHYDISTRVESSALPELRFRSNRPSLKYSRALFNQRSPSRLKERSDSNKAIYKEVWQQPQHKLESNWHDRSATKKPSPAVAGTDGKENLSQREDQSQHTSQNPLEVPVNPKGHAADRQADSTIQDLSSFEHTYEVNPGKAGDKAVVNKKKRILQAISTQIMDRKALIDQTYLIDRPDPLKHEDDPGRTINSDSAKVKLEAVSSSPESPEIQKAADLSEEIAEIQILNTGRTPFKSQIPNKSQKGIRGIKEAKTSLRPIAKGPAKIDVSEAEELPGLDLVSKKIHKSADQGLFGSGTVRARGMPDEKRDSQWPNHHDISLENGMMVSPYRSWPPLPYLRISGTKEDSGSKLTAHREEIAGRSTTSEPQIQITIGRVEVRAALSHTPSPKRSNTNSSSSSSLEEYLRKRSGGMRE